MTVINIRGTSGSGKTHLVRQFVERHGGEEITVEGKPFGYRMFDDRLRVLGRYDAAVKGGGVDNTTPLLMRRFLAGGGVGNSMDAVEAQVREWAALGKHVLFEGLIVTSVWGRWVRMAAELPTLFLFLDTPLEVCYQRVLERSGGRSPKGWAEGRSDLQAKHQNETRRSASIARKEEEEEEVKRQIASLTPHPRQSSLEDFHNRTNARQLPSASAAGLRFTILDHTQAAAQLDEIIAAVLSGEFPLAAPAPAPTPSVVSRATPAAPCQTESSAAPQPNRSSLL